MRSADRNTIKESVITGKPPVSFKTDTGYYAPDQVRKVTPEEIREATRPERDIELAQKLDDMIRK